MSDIRDSALGELGVKAAWGESFGTKHSPGYSTQTGWLKCFSFFRMFGRARVQHR